MYFSGHRAMAADPPSGGGGGTAEGAAGRPATPPPRSAPGTPHLTEGPAPNAGRPPGRAGRRPRSPADRDPGPEAEAVPLGAGISPPPALPSLLPPRRAAPLPPPPGPRLGISPAPPRRAGGGPMEAEMLCGLRAGWGRRRAADAAAGPGTRTLGGEPEAEAGAGGGAGAGTLAGGGGGWDEPGGRLWGQIASRGEAAEWGSERRRGPPGSAMAAQCDPLSGYLQQPLSDPGSNSERSTDSPVPGSEEDSAGPPRPLHSPEWGEERFRVDRKKLEAMLQGEGGERRRRSPGGAGRRRRPGRGEKGRGSRPRPGPPCPAFPFPAGLGVLLSAPPVPQRGGRGPAAARGRREPRGPVPGAVVASSDGERRLLVTLPGAEPSVAARERLAGVAPGGQMRLGAGRPRRGGWRRWPVPAARCEAAAPKVEVSQKSLL